MRPCDFCTLPLPANAPSRLKMHQGCLGRAVRHAKSPDERRKFQHRVYAKRARQRKAPKDHRAHMGKEVRKLDVPVRKAERCEWCPDTHATYAEVLLCRQRFERAQQHVRDR